MATTQLAHHILRIAEADRTPRFYQRLLGMESMGEDQLSNGTRRRLLGYRDSACPSRLDSRAHDGPFNVLLELWIPPTNEPAPVVRARGDQGDGFWKTGITSPDIDTLRAYLIRHGVAVTDARQFLDIGYLCHLSDPDGFGIELLAHQFRTRTDAAPPAGSPGPPADLPPSQSALRQRCAPGIGQITLRVRDIEASLAFYRDALGLRLMSTQPVQPYGFTLYFLAGSDEQAPPGTLAQQREWLWRRPYTTLELQHFEQRPAAYRLYDQAPHGFWGLGLRAPDAAALAQRIPAGPGPSERTEIRYDRLFGSDTCVLRDPDGYAVRLMADRDEP